MTNLERLSKRWSKVDKKRRDSLIMAMRGRASNAAWHGAQWHNKTAELNNAAADLLEAIAEDKPMKDKCKCGSTVVQGECMRDGCEG